jgi:hypothetical protein
MEQVVVVVEEEEEEKEKEEEEKEEEEEEEEEGVLSSLSRLSRLSLSFFCVCSHAEGGGVRGPAKTTNLIESDRI